MKDLRMLTHLANIYPFLSETMCNKQWILDHKDDIIDLLPETWTHIANFSIVPIGYRFKLWGCDWRSEDDLIKCFVVLEQIGLVYRDGFCLRRGY
jgi:hypothetical protein